MIAQEFVIASSQTRIALYIYTQDKKADPPGIDHKNRVLLDFFN